MLGRYRMCGLRAHTRSEKEAVAGAECRVTRAEETRRASCAREAWSRGRVITIEIWQPID